MGMLVTSYGKGLAFPELPRERPAVQVFSGGRFRENLTNVLTGGGSTSSQERAVLESDAAEIENISLAFNKLKFVVDHESQEVLVKVIDPETDKVIKTLPPKELQRLHHKIKEAMGILFDEEV